MLSVLLSASLFLMLLTQAIVKSIASINKHLLLQINQSFRTCRLGSQCCR